MKMLIGITSTHPLLKTVTLIREIHNMIPYDIQQPVADAAAIVLGVSPHAYKENIDKTAAVSPWDLTPQQIQDDILNLLHAGNENCLIEHIHHRITTSKNSILSSMFGGNLVFNITTPEEAEYIRSTGGVMLHIANVKRHAKLKPLSKHEDFTLFVNTDTDPDQHEVLRIARTIEQHFKDREKVNAKEAA